MSTTVWVVIAVVVIAALVALGYALTARLRTERLRRRFGPEYDRVVAERRSRRAAERELEARTEHHRALDLRPMDRAARTRHQAEWAALQERFVDQPADAVAAADRLLTTVMAERGYPTEDYEERVATLSVEHAGTLDRYRRGHDIGVRAGREQVSTEDLRQAMVHYRTLFEELLAVSQGPEHTGRHEDGTTGPGDGHHQAPVRAAADGAPGSPDTTERPGPPPGPAVDTARSGRAEDPRS